MAAADDLVGSAKEGLTTKIAGVPFYVYGGLFVVGFWGWTRWRDRNAIPTEAPIEATPDLIGPDNGTPAALFPTSGVAVNVPGTTGINDTAEKLEDWIANSTDFLVSKGYDATNSNSALRLYATGATVTGAQQRLVSLAIQNYGAPPGATAPKVGQGAGISFDVPSKIKLVPAGPSTIPWNGAFAFDLFWTDGFNQPVTGKLQRQVYDFHAKQWIQRAGHVQITNGYMRTATPTKISQPTHPDVNPGVKKFRYSTIGNDPKFLPAVSNELTYTIVKKPK